LHDFVQYHWGPFSGDLLYLCGAGIHSFFIDAFGRLSLCLTARSTNYDLRKGSFSEAWNTFLPQIISRKARADSKCRRCELLVFALDVPLGLKMRPVTQIRSRMAMPLSASQSICLWFKQAKHNRIEASWAPCLFQNFTFFVKGW